MAPLDDYSGHLEYYLSPDRGLVSVLRETVQSSYGDSRQLVRRLGHIERSRTPADIAAAVGELLILLKDSPEAVMQLRSPLIVSVPRGELGSSPKRNGNGTGNTISRERSMTTVRNRNDTSTSSTASNDKASRGGADP